MASRSNFQENCKQVNCGLTDLGSSRQRTNDKLLSVAIKNEVYDFVRSSVQMQVMKVFSILFFKMKTDLKRMYELGSEYCILFKIIVYQ